MTFQSLLKHTDWCTIYSSHWFSLYVSPAKHQMTFQSLLKHIDWCTIYYSIWQFIPVIDNPLTKEVLSYIKFNTVFKIVYIMTSWPRKCALLITNGKNNSLSTSLNHFVIIKASIKSPLLRLLSKVIRPNSFKVKLIRREFRWIIIRREYKLEDLFIIFRLQVVTSLQLNQKFRPLLYNRSRFHLLFHSIRSSNTLS